MDNKVFEQKLKESYRQLVESALMSITEEYDTLAEETQDYNCKRIAERYHDILRRMQQKQSLYTMDVEELHHNVFATMNGYCSIPEEKLCSLINNEHRALQDTLFRFIKRILRIWHDCYETKRYDDRNKFACKQSYEWIEDM